MSEETIWYRNGEQKVGPFSISTIKELREKNAISDDTLVSDDDGTNWTAYSNFAEKSKDTEPYEIEEKGKNVSEFEIPPINLPLEPTPTKNGNPKDLLITNIESNKKISEENIVQTKQKNLLGYIFHHFKLKHLLYGYFSTVVFYFILESITGNLHLIVLNMILNFDHKLMYGYFLHISPVFFLSLILLIPALIGLLLRPLFYYLIIFSIGFFSIYSALISSNL